MPQKADTSKAAAATNKPRKVDKESELMQKLEERAKQSRKLHTKIEGLVQAADAATTSRTLWGQWLTCNPRAAV